MFNVDSITSILMVTKVKDRTDQQFNLGNERKYGLVGYDWAPSGVDMATVDNEKPVRYVPDPKDYVWQQGASVISESLVTGIEPLINAEHALHVLEIMEAARESQATGKRVKLVSKFKFPVV